MTTRDLAKGEGRRAKGGDSVARWTYDGYWNAVLGATRNALDVVRDFTLTRAKLDEWLDAAEDRAWFAGGSSDPRPDEWEYHRERAQHELKLALKEGA